VGFLAFLNHWWNVPFLVMLGLVAMFFLLQLVGIIGHGADVDHDHDIDHDHDVDGDADADHDAEGGLSWGGVLSFFGVGRVPFMVVWVTLFLFAGFTGIGLNRLFFVTGAGVYRGWHFLVVILAAMVVGAIGVRLFAQLAAKLVDTEGKGSTSKKEMCGKIGVVASAKLDESFGEVRVHDPRGNEMIVHARMSKGEASLERGAKVVLVDFDEKSELFWATASPAEAEAQG